MRTKIVNTEALSSLLKGEGKVVGAPFTVLSHKTHKDYTFKVSRAPYKNVWYTHVRVETGYLQFTYLGFYTGIGIMRKGSIVNTPSAIAAAWVLKRIVTGGDLSGVTIYHTGRCLRCGRELTDAQSIEAGLGPVCINLVN